MFHLWGLVPSLLVFDWLILLVTFNPSRPQQFNQWNWVDFIQPLKPFQPAGPSPVTREEQELIRPTLWGGQRTHHAVPCSSLPLNRCFGCDALATEDVAGCHGKEGTQWLSGIHGNRPCCADQLIVPRCHHMFASPTSLSSLPTSCVFSPQSAVLGRFSQYLYLDQYWLSDTKILSLNLLFLSRIILIECIVFFHKYFCCNLCCLIT